MGRGKYRYIGVTFLYFTGIWYESEGDSDLRCIWLGLEQSLRKQVQKYSEIALKDLKYYTRKHSSNAKEINKRRTEEQSDVRHIENKVKYQMWIQLCQ